MTGFKAALPGLGSDGIQTFRFRQSSLCGVGGGTGGAPLGSGVARQELPNAVVLSTRVCREAGRGARQRCGPTGGAAYGMPLKEVTPFESTEVPWTSPDAVMAGIDCAWAAPVAKTAAKAADVSMGAIRCRAV
jgi:hypothetical protein